MQLKFYKDTDNDLWWIYLPEYIIQGGNPADLQMVCGADDFLERCSQGGRKVDFEIAITRPENWPTEYMAILERLDNIPTWTGKYYRESEGATIMWLCDVTKFVFGGEFPQTIWYKKL